MPVQNEHGFTLIESLLHCIIFSVAALGLAMLLLICYKVPTTADVFHETEFEVVSHDTQHVLLKDVRQIDPKSPTKLTIRREGELKTVELVISEPNLYRSEAAGFEPILGSVHEKSHFTIEQDIVSLTLITLDGFQKERAFYVPTIRQ